MKYLFLHIIFLFSSFCEIAFGAQFSCREYGQTKSDKIELLFKNYTPEETDLETTVYLGNEKQPASAKYLLRFSKEDGTLNTEDKKIISSVDFRFIEKIPDIKILGEPLRNLIFILVPSFETLSIGGQFQAQFVFKNGKRINLEMICN
jgi:hypothetical protein